MGIRRKGREYALQVLYLIDVAKMPAEKALSGVIYGGTMEEPIKLFTKQLVKGAVEHLADIDEIIKRYAANWEMGRMAALDRNILRLGAYELMYELETPVSVIIDEAVEIAKSFSTDDSGKFVNGILEKIKTERKSISAKNNAK